MAERDYDLVGKAAISDGKANGTDLLLDTRHLAPRIYT